MVVASTYYQTWTLYYRQSIRTIWAITFGEKNIAKKAAKTLVENEEDWGNLEKDGIAQWPT